MKLVRYVVPALIVSGLAMSPALAAPAAAPTVVDQAAAPLVQVQYHHDDHGHDHGHYVAGRRYRSAPHGWHRFDRRPGDWRARNCVMVGPVWFCP
jgi:Ni/Co efflux regulator RcnB